MAQQVKNLPAMQETQETLVRSPDGEDPLEEEMATHSNILAWRIPWTEEPGGLQSKRSPRVRHSWAHRLVRLTNHSWVSALLVCQAATLCSDHAHALEAPGESMTVSVQKGPLDESLALELTSEPDLFHSWAICVLGQILIASPLMIQLIRLRGTVFA